MTARQLCSALVLAAVLATPAQARADRKDDEIFRDVSATVLAYTRFTIFDDVSAAIGDGVVRLEGKVTMPFKRDDIERRVASVVGVRRVENRIEVLPVSIFDERLRFAVARAIYGNSSFWQYASMANPPIHIIVEDGRITLTGVVANEVERMLARSLATSFNAFSVTNELKTDDEMRAILDHKRPT
jgi:hyperosmotically inducible periplasmic protein